MKGKEKKKILPVLQSLLEFYLGKSPNLFGKRLDKSPNLFGKRLTYLLYHM